MSPDTPACFDCTPQRGFLQPRPPAGQEPADAPIHVTYTCKEFGTQAAGTLNVYTKTLQYTFRVVGQQPKYQPPNSKDFTGKVR